MRGRIVLPALQKTHDGSLEEVRIEVNHSRLRRSEKKLGVVIRNMLPHLIHTAWVQGPDITYLSADTRAWYHTSLWEFGEENPEVDGIIHQYLRGEDIEPLFVRRKKAVLPLASQIVADEHGGVVEDLSRKASSFLISCRDAIQATHPECIAVHALKDGGVLVEFSDAVPTVYYRDEVYDVFPQLRTVKALYKQGQFLVGDALLNVLPVTRDEHV